MFVVVSLVLAGVFSCGGPTKVEVLRERLVKRGTDSAEEIERRVGKAAEEMEYAPLFDHVLVNDDLATAFAEAEEVVDEFLSK